MGVVGNMSQLSFFAMINYLDRDSVIKFTGGTAIGGILLTLCRMIFVAIVGSDSTSSIPILIYFLIAIAVNLLDLVLNVKFARSNDYKKKILSFLP